MGAGGGVFERIRLILVLVGGTVFASLFFRVRVQFSELLALVPSCYLLLPDNRVVIRTPAASSIVHTLQRVLEHVRFGLERDGLSCRNCGCCESEERKLLVIIV